MTSTSAFVRIGGITLIASIVMAGIGFLLVRSNGLPSPEACLAACGASWLSSLCGAVPIASAVGKKSKNAAEAILLATALRFFGVLLLIVPLTFSGWFDRKVFVLSAALSYLILLALDTVISLPLLRARPDELKS